MPYSYTLSTVIAASPEEIYEAWLDSIAHAEMTASGEAVMSDEIGAEISALDGQITGRNLELVANRRIVQAWRTDEFGDETEDSIVTILLQNAEGGTLLTLEHSNVPDRFKSYEEGGWQSNYFEPMAVYFSEFEEVDLAEPERPELMAESEAEDEAGHEPETEDEVEGESGSEPEPETAYEHQLEDQLETGHEGNAAHDHTYEREPEPEASDQREEEAETEYERADETESEVTAAESAPVRAAAIPGAHERKVHGRERRAGGLSARRATPRPAADPRKIASPTVATDAKASTKKAVEPAAKKAATPPAKKKSAAKKKAAAKTQSTPTTKSAMKKKSATKQKSAAKKKGVKPSAKKPSTKKASAKKTSTKRKGAQKPARGAAQRGATKKTARSSAAHSRKAARGRR